MGKSKEIDIQMFIFHETSLMCHRDDGVLSTHIKAIDWFVPPVVQLLGGTFTVENEKSILKTFKNLWNKMGLKPHQRISFIASWQCLVSKLLNILAQKLSKYVSLEYMFTWGILIMWVSRMWRLEWQRETKYENTQWTSLLMQSY